MIINPLPVVNPLLPPIPPVFSAQGTSTTNVTNAETNNEGNTTFTLGVTATNGFRANYGVGPEGDIDHKINFQVTSDGKVGINGGSDSKTYPTLDIHRYSMDDKGNVTEKLLINQNEKDISDLTKPKEPLPVVIPQ